VIEVSGLVSDGRDSRQHVRRRFVGVAAVFAALGALVIGAHGQTIDNSNEPSVAPGPLVGVGSATASPQTPKTDPEPSTSAPTQSGEELSDSSESATTGDWTADIALASLEVKGRAPMTGYDRDQFGQRWLDLDRNGCDTRNDTLARDLVEVEKSGPCRVLRGTLIDPYTGGTIAFIRGQGTSERVQIDHVVSLSDAWQKGAQQLTAGQRATFANDPLNLLAVDGPTNAQKGAGDAATWLPSNKAFRCEYVARQVSVKAAYRLWVTAAERDAIARVLSACPAQPAFASVFADANGRAPDHSQEDRGRDGADDVSFASCADARAAGAAPIRAGKPGYSPNLDGDGDGIACDS
jgi:hypothetical protein